MKIVIAIVAALLVLSGAVFASYKFGEKNGFETGYSHGKSDYSSSTDAFSVLLNENNHLIAENEKLVGDYNKLVSEVNSVMNQPVQAPKQSFSCSTNVLSNTAYTNCN